MLDKKGKIRTRFAPSPTGDMHIGGLRTSLYSYALAKHGGGDFILRIEDTDKKREVKGSTENIKNMLKLFDLHWDEYYVQSERVKTGIYKKEADKLVKNGYAFCCNCDPKNAKEGYSKELRDPCREKGLDEGAIKLKIPENEKISFVDFVLNKKVEWETNVLADTTLLKSDGFPTYHLAVVVDDNDINITHALRGHDWMPSTPIHLLVYKHLGYQVPEIGHLTDILDPEGGKLSKRKSSISVSGMIKEGYMPDALLNFVMLLGWAPKDDRELYSLDEFVKAFTIDGFQRSNPVFNRDKLDWFNGEYIRKTNNAKLKTKIYEFFRGKYDLETVGKVVPLIKDRIKTLGEFETIAGFFQITP
jgi:glutamyl-tRNA synthetase